MVDESGSWVITAEEGKCVSVLNPYTGGLEKRRYGDKRGRIHRFFGRHLPPLLEDLVDLALCVYVADRLVRRRAPGADIRKRWSWMRPLELVLPVSDPDRWNAPEVQASLCEALEFLTEDRWSFKFVPLSRKTSRAAEQLRLFDSPGSTVLFSGGLDSLAGLSLDLVGQELENFTAFSFSSNPRLFRKQALALGRLGERFPRNLKYLILSAKICQRRRDYNFNERSQRGRGFVFCLLGAVTALMSGQRRLRIYENGVGSLNLPISDSQLGCQSTRATNPLFLEKLEKFLSSILGSEFVLDLPNVKLTKGQMCLRLREHFPENWASLSVSCDGFPARMLGAQQCGFCSSCILRRQALWVAGFESDRDPENYRFDIFDNDVSLAKSVYLWDMLSQVDRLDRAIRSPEKWRRLVVEYPELRETVELKGSNKISPDEVVRLYERYCDEWKSVPFVAQGWRFTSDRLCA